MTSTPEWLPEITIRRRLWARAKFKRTDIKLAVAVRELIPNLIAAHVKNWYDSKPPTNFEGISVIEWSEQLKFVCRLRPDIWPGGGLVAQDKAPIANVNASAVKVEASNAERRKRTAYRLERTQERMRADAKNKIDLNAMTEKELEGRYNVSRDTARKARKAVMAEHTLNIVDRHVTTNDK
jgi:hypothetical protein